MIQELHKQHFETDRPIYNDYLRRLIFNYNEDLMVTPVDQVSTLTKTYDQILALHAKAVNDALTTKEHIISPSPIKKARTRQQTVDAIKYEPGLGLESGYDSGFRSRTISAQMLAVSKFERGQRLFPWINLIPGGHCYMKQGDVIIYDNNCVRLLSAYEFEKKYDWGE